MYRYVLSLSKRVSGGSYEYCFDTDVWQTTVYSDLKDVLIHVTSIVNVNEKNNVHCSMYDYMSVECREINFNDKEIDNDIKWKVAQSFRLGISLEEFDKFLARIGDAFNKMIRGE